MEKSERTKRAYDLAFGYEQTLGACAQPVMKALQEVFDQKDDAAFKGLTGFAAGVACQVEGMCGAFAAGVFFLSRIVGRSLDDIGKDTEDPYAVSKVQGSFDIIKEYYDRFIEEYGSTSCEGIMRKLYGRSYYIYDSDEFEKFDKRGAHEWAETGVCGKAAGWAVEIIEENELNL